MQYAQKLGHDRGARDFHEDNVIQSDAVKGVQEGKLALDFMRLDHALKDIAHREGLSLTGEVIRHGKDRAQIVGWVAPFGGKPAVVEVEPSDHGTNVEGAVYGVELVVGAGHLAAVGDSRAFHSGTQDLPALLELQPLKTATERVNEDPARGVELYEA